MLFPEIILPSVAALAVVACVAVWWGVIARRRQGRPAIPYQPRRPVPWGIIDVSLLMISSLVAPTLIFHALCHWLGGPPPVQPQVAERSGLDVIHPLARVLLESPNLWAILMCALLAVVITPITEELIYRLLFQGWLESLERRLRGRIRPLRRIAAGMAPVALVSLLFAALHFRTPEPKAELSDIIMLLSALYLSELLVIVVLICWLKYAAGATLADLGFVPGKLVSDIKLGLLALPAIIVPIYVLLFATKQLLPENTIVDPFFIFPLAVALGTLYYRTHRIVPGIVLHMTFNATGVILALLTSGC